MADKSHSYKRPASREADDEAEIRGLLDGWTKALHAKDIDGAMAHHAPDILAYDLAPPLEHRGAGVYRNNLAEWFPTFQGPIVYEVHDLNVTMGDDVAFSTSLNRLRGKRTDGEQTDVWVRATLGYRRIDGHWTVTHEHVSVPFYMDGSYKAAVDLRPS